MDGDGGRRGDRDRDRDSTGWGRTERMGRNIVRKSRDLKKRKDKKDNTRYTAKQNALQGQRFRRRTYMHTNMCIDR